MKDSFFRCPSVKGDRQLTIVLYSLIIAFALSWIGSRNHSTVLLGQDATATQPVLGGGAAPVAVSLKHSSLTESSGVAISHRRAHRIWTHNDSGDKARLFAFDTSGRSTGVWQIPAAKAVDWEDIASFEIDGRKRLLVADVGDNDGNRSEVQLYLFDEPDPDRSGSVHNVETIRVRLPGGPCDCEAVAVDVSAAEIWLATKRRLPICDLSVVPFAATGQTVTARHVARVAVPMVTAMDISEDSASLVLGGYFDAFVYRKTEPTESWSTALRRTPLHQVMPPLKQIEAICFAGKQQVWVTSEGSPSKMIKLNLPENR